jgi:hypothetical protein
MKFAFLYQYIFLILIMRFADLCRNRLAHKENHAVSVQLSRLDKA